MISRRYSMTVYHTIKNSGGYIGGKGNGGAVLVAIAGMVVSLCEKGGKEK